MEQQHKIRETLYHSTPRKRYHTIRGIEEWPSFELLFSWKIPALIRRKDWRNVSIRPSMADLEWLFILYTYIEYAFLLSFSQAARYRVKYIRAPQWIVQDPLMKMALSRSRSVNKADASNNFPNLDPLTNLKSTDESATSYIETTTNESAKNHRSLLTYDNIIIATRNLHARGHRSPLQELSAADTVPLHARAHLAFRLGRLISFYERSPFVEFWQRATL